MDTQVPAPCHVTSNKSSLAYISVKDRWPKIVTGALDDIHRTSLSCIEEPKASEGKTIVAGLATLKYEIQHDRQLEPLPDDGQPDIKDYNTELEALGPRKWFNIPWLFAECYLYRRIHTFFSLSTHWKRHDVFSRQKLSAFRSSRTGVLELAARYKTLLTELENKTSSEEEDYDAEQTLFVDICQISLWSDSTYLSPLADPFQILLIDDLSAAYSTLKIAREQQNKQTRTISILLSHAGLSLYTSLLLSSFLLTTNLATTIILHPKSIPWFVHDATLTDFTSILAAVANPQSFFGTAPPEEEGTQDHLHPTPLSAPELERLEFLFQHWSALHAEGKIVLRPNEFWTSPYSYWELPSRAPGLFEDLTEAELVVFLGHLNYRKLIADGTWSPITPFRDAIGPLGRGVRVLALGSCENDTVVGLGEGADERLREEKGGVWVVAQFCDGKV